MRLKIDMIQVTRHALVPYTAEQMFNLVNNIEVYPDFLPWCKEASILSSTEQSIEARLKVSQGAVTQAFTTINELIKNQKIVMRLKEGPFKHLEGIWLFEPCQEGCHIRFDMQFEFSNPIMAALISGKFKTMVGTLVQAFTDRAKQVY